MRNIIDLIPKKFYLLSHIDHEYDFENLMINYTCTLCARHVASYPVTKIQYLDNVDCDSCVVDDKIIKVVDLKINDPRKCDVDPVSEQLKESVGEVVLLNSPANILKYVSKNMNSEEPRLGTYEGICESFP